MKKKAAHLFGVWPMMTQTILIEFILSVAAKTSFWLAMNHTAERLAHSALRASSQPTRLSSPVKRWKNRNLRTSCTAASAP